MKKLSILLFVTLFSVFHANAKEYTKAEEEALIQKFLKMHEKTQAMKKETESIKKVGKKLDEILGVLEKDKK